VPNIAVVEDESIVALDIKNLLERSGYLVSGLFSSGEDLLARMDELKPDLILMDIKIRGRLDGVATAQLIHERYKTPVILLTAFADEATVSRAKLTQPFGYILKPFEERELRTAVEIALYRAAMEARLRKSEERYRSLFNEGITGNFLADPDGRLTEANPAFRRLVGLEPEARLPLLSSLFPDAAAWDSFRAGILSARKLELAELPLRSNGGTELVVLANVAAVISDDGVVTGIRGELADATERRRLEERLVQGQKMEAVGRLAGGIAHDFNNILTAILGYVNLLAEDIPETSEARADLEGIRGAASRATNLTRQLLAFSRRQPFSPIFLDLNGLVQDAERLLRRLLTEGVSLGLDLGSGSVVVKADPVQMEQVLLNLVINAKDAMPSGGTIRISTRAETIAEPRTMGLDTLPPGPYAVLDVRDTGGGIDPKIIGRIFEPFFTTKSKESGTGLGLSTVYGIVKQSGGAMDVVSHPGLGSVFAVWLPLDPGLLESPSVRIKKGGGIESLGTILFVDDDESVRSLGGRLLAKRGHRALAASNAIEALSIAESYEGPIDLLVTDVVLPFIDGYSLSRRLEERRPGISTLFISGHPDRAADSEVAGRFLSKPFSEEELSDAVIAALDRRGAALRHAGR
jgi:two-component system cell cycle sensor histidine kinase/response regulator CckA